MKLLLLSICFWTLSCNTRQTVIVDSPKLYSDTSSLFYKGAPLFVFNERLDKQNSRPTFYQDTTTRQGDGYSFITIDTFFSAQQSTGTIIGNLIIETNNLTQIQRVRGYWVISVQMNDKTKHEAIDTIKKRFFPNLTKELLSAEIDTIRHENFIEEFKFSQSANSGDVNHGHLQYWSFYYDAKRQKNGL